MNTQKYRINNCGLFFEADRTMYDKKDSISHSIIDPKKTGLNYNLCPHPQYSKDIVRKINESIRGKKLPQNAVAWGSTIITIPKDYEGNTEEFFKTAYNGLKEMYGLKDEDIISAYVHMDETTPHMHFYFIPVMYGNKDKISWDEVMPRKLYQTQHKTLQKYMKDTLKQTVNLLNGETMGFEVQKLDADQKKKNMELADITKKVDYEKEILLTVQMAIEEQQTLTEITNKIDWAEETITHIKTIIKEVIARYQNTLERLTAVIQKIASPIRRNRAEKKLKEIDSTYTPKILKIMGQIAKHEEPDGETMEAVKTSLQNATTLYEEIISVENADFEDDFDR